MHTYTIFLDTHEIVLRSIRKDIHIFAKTLDCVFQNIFYENVGLQIAYWQLIERVISWYEYYVFNTYLQFTEFYL